MTPASPRATAGDVQDALPQDALEFRAVLCNVFEVLGQEVDGAGFQGVGRKTSVPASGNGA